MSYTKQVLQQRKKIQKQKIYYGVCEAAFKLRYANHKKTFSNIKYQTDTELSNEYSNIISAKNSPTYPGKFWEPTNNTTKVLKDVSYVSMKS